MLEMVPQSSLQGTAAATWNDMQKGTCPSTHCSSAAHMELLLHKKFDLGGNRSHVSPMNRKDAPQHSNTVLRWISNKETWKKAQTQHNFTFSLRADLYEITPVHDKQLEVTQEQSESFIKDREAGRGSHGNICPSHDSGTAGLL